MVLDLENLNFIFSEDFTNRNKAIINAKKDAMDWDITNHQILKALL
jgi:hypothetical protein